MFKKLKNVLIKTAEHFENKRVEKANKKFDEEYYELEEEPTTKDGEAVPVSPWIKSEEEKGQFDEVKIKGGVARRLPKSKEENQKHVDELKNKAEKERVPEFSDVWTPPEDLNSKDRMEYEDEKARWEKLSDKDKIADLEEWKASELETEEIENKKHIDELKNEVEKEEVKPRSLGLRRKLPSKAGAVNEQDQYYDLLKTDPKAAMELPYYKRRCAEIDQAQRGEKHEESIKDVVEMHEEIEKEKQDVRDQDTEKRLDARKLKIHRLYQKKKQLIKQNEEGKITPIQEVLEVEKELKEAEQALNNDPDYDPPTKEELEESEEYHLHLEEYEAAKAGELDQLLEDRRKKAQAEKDLQEYVKKARKKRKAKLELVQDKDNDLER